MLEVKVLNNGIRVILEEIPYVNSAAMGIWVKAGAIYENEAQAGISHLIEHMIFKGTESRNAKEIAQGMDRIGAQMNAFTGKELTCYYVKTLSTHSEEAMDILLDMFTKSTFDTAELEKEKFVIYEEMKMIEDNPDEYVHEKLGDILLSGSKYENSIIGTVDSVKGISREDIFKYMKDEYTRDSMVVSIVGKFDKSAIFEKLEETMGQFNERKDLNLKAAEIYKPDFKVKVKDVEQTHICLGTRALDAEDKGSMAMKVLNSVVGGTMSSRLFQHIREEKGLAYSVYSSYAPLKDEGEYTIYAGVSHENAPEAIEAIKAELMKLRKEGISSEELAMAKEQVKAAYIFGYESVNTRMFHIGKNLALMDKIKEPESVMDEIDAIKPEEISRVVDLISNIDNYSAVMVSKNDLDVKKLMRA